MVFFKFPCELAAAFDLNVMYPENQAAGIAANRYGEMMCQAAEDLGYDNDICGYARISLCGWRPRLPVNLIRRPVSISSIRPLESP